MLGYFEPLTVDLSDQLFINVPAARLVFSIKSSLHDLNPVYMERKAIS